MRTCVRTHPPRLTKPTGSLTACGSFLRHRRRREALSNGITRLHKALFRPENISHLSNIVYHESSTTVDAQAGKRLIHTHMDLRTRLLVGPLPPVIMGQR
eukprot:COSAG02_NODE_164_length_32230_cov_37.505587_24_plen_100_part_00